MSDPTPSPLATPISELAALSDEDRFTLAAGGNAHAQEWMAHRLLSTVADTARALEAAEVWAQMATCRGHVLSVMTYAQLMAARGVVAGEAGDKERAIDCVGRAVALFDILAEQGEPYSMSVNDRIFSRLQMEGCEDIHARILARAKQLSGG